MKFYKSIFILLLAFTLSFVSLNIVKAGFFVGNNGIVVTQPETDNNVGILDNGIFYFFDLRERETFIQLTYPDSNSSGQNAIAHVQVFDVSNNCNENDFFDGYTINDTHTYNMRDIQTNDGNPSGVVLPDGSYGIVAITLPRGIKVPPGTPFGNLRIIDDNGYEYRTNAQTISPGFTFPANPVPAAFMTFNFNSFSGVTLSDVVGLTFTGTFSNNLSVWDASSLIPSFISLDVDILNSNETIFSCRDIIFACVDEGNPRLEELLEFAGSANVASFEYGINEAIPHSKNGELLCPGNNISEGIVKLNYEPYPSNIDQFAIGNGPFFLGYIGLNNGNGRGSLDSFWIFNTLINFQQGG
jgi:hypothetical protein